MHSHSYSNAPPQTSLSGSGPQQVKSYLVGTPNSNQESLSSFQSHSKSSFHENGHSEGHPGAGQSPEVALLTSGTSQILIASVVQRLVNRLPCNSGGRLSSLEEEELIRSSVANLVIHSEFQLVVVVKELLAVLESLNKVSIPRKGGLLEYDAEVDFPLLPFRFFTLANNPINTGRRIWN
jgi:hypothetical protein